MKTKWTHVDILDLTGKTAIVTGANSGIGFETARELAGKGASVVLACRSPEKAEEASDNIRQEHPNSLLSFIPLDLADLDSVRAFAESFNSEHETLDLLVNNAGVMIPPFSQTKEGFESQMGTNHFGHFALTGLLLRVLMKTEGSRVVNVSSIAHKPGFIDFDDLHWNTRKYKPWKAYSQSKLANLLFTFELQRRLEKAQCTTISLASHPGWTSTDLQKHSGIAMFFNPILAQKPIQGAWPTLFAAVSKDARGGEFYGPGGFFELRGSPAKVGSSKKSRDLDVASRLFAVSEDLTGVEFP